MKYLDGAVADSVPVEDFQKMGYEKNVVILTREAGYEKKDGSMLIIRPENPLNIGRLENNPEKIQEIYDIGYRDGMKWTEKVKEFIG